MWDFDDSVTAPLHGFAGADDYWTRASSKPWLARVALPTLVLNARNDPFVPAASLPTSAEVGPHVFLEQPVGGGHCGFMTGPAPGRIDWLPRRILRFFDEVEAGRAALIVRNYATMLSLPREIFKAYDIRGVVGKTLTPDVVRAVGQALGTRALELGRDTFAIGRDGRLSGPELAAALAEGLRKSGVDVIDLGMVATPMTYFAAQHLDTQCSVMVTGSHNPPDYNGLKMVVDGSTLSGDDIQAVRTRIEEGRFATGVGRVFAARHRARVHRADHRRREAHAHDEDRGGLRQRRGGRIRADALPQDGLQRRRALLRRRREFPEPSSRSVAAQESHRPRAAAVRKGDCELGLAFDGDGDRLGVVTRDGQVIYPDRQLMLFAADLLTRMPGRDGDLRRQVHAQPASPGSRATAACPCCGRRGIRSSRPR